jgi:hypothetical protein
MKYQFDPFVITYDKVKYPIQEYNIECILAAKKARALNTRNLPIAILMSGGIDSEVVANSFLRAGIPFVAIIGRLYVRLATEKVYMNEHDYAYAENWCVKHNIIIVYCDIDIYKEAQLLSRYALESKGFSPQLAWHMYLMKWSNDQGYFFISGIGDIEIEYKDGEYHSTESQREFSIDIFCEKYDLSGVVRFWKLDSRLIASFLQLSRVKELMNAKVEKLLSHKHYYFEEVLDFAPRSKQTGFERIQEWDSVLRTYLKKHNGQYDDTSYVPISFFKEEQ